MTRTQFDNYLEMMNGVDNGYNGIDGNEYAVIVKWINDNEEVSRYSILDFAKSLLNKNEIRLCLKLTSIWFWQ